VRLGAGERIGQGQSPGHCQRTGRRHVLKIAIQRITTRYHGTNRTLSIT
jgi:hypothetical protein